MSREQDYDDGLFNGGMVSRRRGRFSRKGGSHEYSDDDTYSGGLDPMSVLKTAANMPYSLLKKADGFDYQEIGKEGILRKMTKFLEPYQMIFNALIIVLVLTVIYLIFHAIFKKPSGGSSSSSKSSKSKKKKSGYSADAPSVITLLGDSRSAFHDDDDEEDKGILSNFMSGFFGGADQPLFSDSPNNIIRSEDREREAVMALSKINQERQRRMATGEVLEPVTSWDSFWRDWQVTHPQDGDGIVLPDELGSVEAGMY